MKLNLNNALKDNAIIQLKDQQYLDNQRIAGLCVSGCLNYLVSLVEDRNELTTLELSKKAEQFIVDKDCTPTFKGYKGFPEVCCISINHQLVHGIPNEYKLQDGDLITFDLGATYKGAIADSAVTVIYGRAKSERDKELIDATELCLYNAIKSIKIGKRLGCIGNAIYKIAREKRFNVIEDYGGHGINLLEDGSGEPHAAPFVSNKSNINEGIIIQAGLTIAIEPLLTYGSSKTKIMQDGWSVEMLDKSICSHFEHTLFIHNDHIEIISYRDNEKYLESNIIRF